MHGGHAIIHHYVAGDDREYPVENIRLHAGRIYAGSYRSGGYDSSFEMDLNNFTLHISSKDPVVKMFRPVYLSRPRRGQALPAHGQSYVIDRSRGMTLNLMRLANWDLVKKWLFDHPGIDLEQSVPAARGGIKEITSYLCSGMVLNNQGSS